MASKLVSLPVTSWTEITTIEALQEAVTNGTDMDVFHEISVTSTADYDLVLGVEYDNNYYMLHITHADVINALTGTVAEITGDYKSSAVTVTK